MIKFAILIVSFVHVSCAANALICLYGGYCSTSTDCVAGSICTKQSWNYNQCTEDQSCKVSSRYGQPCKGNEDCCSHTCILGSCANPIDCTQPTGFVTPTKPPSFKPTPFTAAPSSITQQPSSSIISNVYPTAIPSLSTQPIYTLPTSDPSQNISPLPICRFGGYCRATADCAPGNKCNIQSMFYSQCVQDDTQYTMTNCVSDYRGCSTTTTCCNPGAFCGVQPGSTYKQCLVPQTTSPYNRCREIGAYLTAIPTESPLNDPSLNPSGSPTTESPRSAEPSVSPSWDPSAEPTTTLTTIPSTTPSTGPTVLPSLAPSNPKLWVLGRPGDSCVAACHALWSDSHCAPDDSGPFAWPLQAAQLSSITSKGLYSIASQSVVFSSGFSSKAICQLGFVQDRPGRYPGDPETSGDRTVCFFGGAIGSGNCSAVSDIDFALNSRICPCSIADLPTASPSTTLSLRPTKSNKPSFLSKSTVKPTAPSSPPSVKPTVPSVSPSVKPTMPSRVPTTFSPTTYYKTWVLSEVVSDSCDEVCLRYSPSAICQPDPEGAFSWPETAEQMFSIAARGVYNLAINKMYYRLCSRSVDTDIFDIEPDPQTDDHLVSVCYISNSGDYSCANKKTPSHLRICPCTNQDRPSAAPSTAAPSTPTAPPTSAPSNPTETPTNEPSIAPHPYPTTAPDSCTLARPGNACTVDADCCSNFCSKTFKICGQILFNS